jgi:phage shock protein E
MKTRALFAMLVLLPASVFAFGQAQKTEAQPDYRDTAALEKLTEGKSTPYFLVDVRTPEEYAGGYIPTAINIPVTEIGQRPPTKDLDALIVVYCRSGNRSGTAQKILQEMGYRNVVNYGAVSNWRKPLVTGDTPAAD